MATDFGDSFGSAPGGSASRLRVCVMIHCMGRVGWLFIHNSASPFSYVVMVLLFFAVLLLERSSAWTRRLLVQFARSYSARVGCRTTCRSHNS